MERIKKNRAFFWLPILLLFCFFILHGPLEIWSKTLFVDPILSKIQFEGDPIAQWAFAVLLFGLGAYLIYKTAIRYRYSAQRVIWILAACLCYAYLRWKSNRWIFTDRILINGHSIKALDLIAVTAIFFILSASIVIWLTNKQQTSRTGTGFSTDEPRIITNDTDRHQRLRYIQTISRLLVNTDVSKRAFAIGISGVWGSGKTTFLSGLEMKLKDNFISIHFNPWRISESKGITEAFFHELSYQISLRIDTLTNDLSEYIRAITSEKDSNPIIGIVKKSFPTIRWSQSSIEDLRSRINDALIEAGKKFLICIDDLDRLDDEEVVETLRIIRNSADFVNLVFVVAYDKSQIAGALSEKFLHGSSKFLEKVFQHEFHLPEFNKDELLEELNRQLEQVLSEGDNESRKKMFEQHAFNYSYASLKNDLSHYRDIARYVNLFKVHYSFLDGQVYLPDLYKVMFLRLKYPGVAILLYERRKDFLTNFEDIRVRRQGEETKFIELKQDSNKNPAIEAELTAHPLHYGIVNGEVTEVISKLSEIFPPSNDLSLFRINKVPNSEFTIRDVDYFDRYFDEDLSSRLSNIEFQLAYLRSKGEFLDKVEEWIQDSRVTSDLIKTLERRLSFKSKDDFDKVLSALALIADYVPPDGERQSYSWRIDDDKAFGRIAYEKNTLASKRVKLFGDFDSFKRYVLDFLNENLKFGSFRFTMLEKFIDRAGSYDGCTLSKDEALNMAKSVFDKMLFDLSKTSIELIQLYNYLTRKLPTVEHANTRSLFREFVFVKDVDGFIEWMISQVPFEHFTFSIDNWVYEMFEGSLESFVERLRLYPFNTSYRDEFLDFYEKNKADLAPGKAIVYDFKTIPVRRQPSNDDEQL